MRILYVCGDGIFAGLEKITLQLVLAARAAGHDVLCLGSHWGSGEFTSRLLAEGLPLERTWFGFISLSPRREPLAMTLAQLGKLPTLWRDFRRVVREWKPDVIHHTNFHHAFLLACGPTRLGVPSVYQVHNAFHPTCAVRQGFRQVGRYVDRFVAVSQFVRQRLLQLGVADHKIAVVMNGVPLPASVQRVVGGLRWEQGWTDDDVLFGIAGQIAGWKGHEDFIRAVTLAQQEDPRIKAIIIGSGAPDYIASLRVLAQQGLPGSVVFAGFRENMDEVYRQLDAVVVPSHVEEAFSLSAAEAMAYGLPVVATRRGAIPEVLGDELKAWLVPAADPAALSEKIRRLAGDRRLRQDVGMQARQRAARVLALERCVHQMLDTYGAVLGQRNSEASTR